jgi:hypothetical protein
LPKVLVLVFSQGVFFRGPGGVSPERERERERERVGRGEKVDGVCGRSAGKKLLR